MPRSAVSEARLGVAVAATQPPQPPQEPRLRLRGRRNSAAHAGWRAARRRTRICPPVKGGVLSGGPRSLPSCCRRPPAKSPFALRASGRVAAVACRRWRVGDTELEKP